MERNELEGKKARSLMRKMDGVGENIKMEGKEVRK
jgi:hypothetical protein